MSGSSSLPPRGLILLGPLKKACRRAPRALSCFIRRSLDLLFWNQTCTEAKRRQVAVISWSPAAFSVWFQTERQRHSIAAFTQMSSLSCQECKSRRCQIQTLITITTSLSLLRPAQKNAWSTTDRTENKLIGVNVIWVLIILGDFTDLLNFMLIVSEFALFKWNLKCFFEVVSLSFLLDLSLENPLKSAVVQKLQTFSQMTQRIYFCLSSVTSVTSWPVFKVMPLLLASFYLH